MKEGWKCPVCERGVNPERATCDHGETEMSLVQQMAAGMPHTVHHYHHVQPAWVQNGNYWGAAGSLGGIGGGNQC